MTGGKPNTIEKILGLLVVCEPAELPTGCWVWPRYVNRDGYGRVSWQGRMVTVHKLVYDHFLGAVPVGLELDHLCRNRACANFEHLEPVSHKTNCHRGKTCSTHMAQTHCRKGHPYEGDNLLVSSKGHRYCRACA